MSKRIWITWETQRRNRTLSKELGAALYEFDIKGGWAKRYGLCIFKTFVTFIKERPTVIFVQNPSLLLAVLAVHYGKITKVPVIVDAHYAGLFPFDKKHKWANMVCVRVIRVARLTIVTNDNSKRYVEKMGGRAHVLTDPIPEFPAEQKYPLQLKGKRNVLFICTYASDEPYLEVVNAASLIDKDIVFYVTGKIKQKQQSLLQSIPNNVVLTDYLPEGDYVRMLHSVDVIIDLTTREDCLVCGAYEAVGAGKPLITSGSQALRKVFNRGVLYTDNTSRDLAEKVCSALAAKAELQSGIIELKINHLRDRERNLKQFEAFLLSAASL